ncbi:MAG: hypothetical protein WCA16_04210, partial [Candidatus Sulfotelmatobacter sp.]
MFRASKASAHSDTGEARRSQVVLFRKTAVQVFAAPFYGRPLRPETASGQGGDSPVKGGTLAVMGERANCFVMAMIQAREAGIPSPVPPCAHADGDTAVKSSRADP